MRSVNTLKIGISGKREIAGEEQARVHKEIRERISGILKHYKCETFIGYSSLAAGADTIFASVVVSEFKQPLYAILPFAKAEYEKDFEDPETFRNSLKDASHFETAAELPVDNRQRNEAYFTAGKIIADRCDEMVIVWDGLKPGGVGGTADIMGYWAEKQRKDPEKKHQYPIPYIKVQPLKADPLHEQLVHGYHRANRLAIKARNRYRRVWKWAISLGWITVACFAIKTAFYHKETTGIRLLTLLEFLCVLAVYLLIFLARKRDYHGIYLRERKKAETCRLMRSFYHAGVEIGISSRFKADNEVAQLAEEMNRKLASERARSKWYTQYVIRCLLAEQCAYHRKKMRSIGNHHQIFERLNLFIGIMFIVNLAVHLVHLYSYENVEDMLLYKLSVFFNILLPASYAALEGVIYFNEWAVLRNYSEAAELSLRAAGSLLMASLDQKEAEECYKAQAHVLHWIARIMLTDNKNWNFLLENKGYYHMMV